MIGMAPFTGLVKPMSQAVLYNRLYLANDTIPFVPSIKLGWSQGLGDGYVRSKLSVAPAGDSLQYNNTKKVGSGTNQTTIFSQLVSNPFTADFTLDGAFSFVIGAHQSSGVNDAYIYLALYVTEGDTNNMRGGVYPYVGIVATT